MNEVVYENARYQVEVFPSDADGTCYHIRSKEHGVVEQRVDTKPQALILAKQFDLLLENNMWEREVNQMYGIGLRSVEDFH